MQRVFIWFVITLVPLMVMVTSAVPAEAQGAVIPFGAPQYAALQTPGEADTFTFPGTAGDTIYLWFARTSGDFWPRISILSPTGIEVKTGYTSGGVYDAEVKLTESGTYTLILSDGYDGSHTGYYAVMVQSIRAPGSAAALQAGRLVASSLSTPGEVDSYTFPASPGDAVYLKLTRASGDLWPELTVFSPSGTRVKSSYTSGGSEEFTVKLTEAGTYLVLADDGYDGSHSGSYGLLMQKIPGIGNAPEVRPGSQMTGSLDMPGEVDSYAFAAGAGDTVKLRLTRTSGELWPKLVLLSPTGVTLESSYTSGGNLDKNVQLTESGTYLILAQDGYDGSHIGAYSLTVTLVSGSGAAAPGPATASPASPSPGGTGTPVAGSATTAPSGSGGPGADTSLLLVAGGIGLAFVILAIAIVVAKGRKKAVRPPVAPGPEVVPPSADRARRTMHDVFISYSSEDKPIADAICANLESRRIRCWIAPRDILPGTSYAQGILDGIEGSQVFVVVFSSYSNSSPHVMREVERAVNLGLPIITFRIEDVVPSHEMKYYLGPIHWLDAISKPVEAHINKLAETVEYLLRHSGKYEPPVPVKPESEK